MYVMSASDNVTIENLTFAVEYFVTNGGRTQWHYTVTDADGTVLADGTDLGTPDYAEADAALQSLIGFASAAGDPHSGAGNCGFPEAAVEAFAAISDELALIAE